MHYRDTKIKRIIGVLGVPEWLLCFCALLAIVPAVVTNPYSHHLFILSLIFALLVSTWNILFGFMGVYSFGHQAFSAWAPMPRDSSRLSSDGPPGSACSSAALRRFLQA